MTSWKKALQVDCSMIHVGRQKGIINFNSDYIRGHEVGIRGGVSHSSATGWQWSPSLWISMHIINQNKKTFIMAYDDFSVPVRPFLLLCGSCFFSLMVHYLIWAFMLFFCLWKGIVNVSWFRLLQFALIQGLSRHHVAIEGEISHSSPIGFWWSFRRRIFVAQQLSDNELNGNRNCVKFSGLCWSFLFGVYFFKCFEISSTF